MSKPIDWRAWLALGRVSNLPTVWTNILAGLALGDAMGVHRAESKLSYGEVVLNVWPLLVGVSLLYVGGMILNDVCDVAVDHRQRPQRPLPSGRVSRNAALAVTIAMGAAGLGLVAMGGVATAILGLALAGTIAAYDIWHKRSVWSVLLMGACRGLVYWLAMAWGLGAVHVGGVGLGVAVIMTAYTVFITIAARGEASDQPTWQRAGRIVAWLMLLTPLGVLAVIEPVAGPWKWPLWMTLAVVVVWLARSLWLLTRRQPRIGRAVEGYLAGFCLVDGLLLLRLDLPYAGLAAGALFGLTLLAHRWIKGT
jgi:4-hydroxybenzoate polyprenyltransferase